MNVLKSKLSGYYFKDFGVWTSDCSDALTFTDPLLAREFIAREHLADVQVIEPAVRTPTEASAT